MTNTNIKGCINRAIEALEYAGDSWLVGDLDVRDPANKALEGLKAYRDEVNEYPNNMHKQAKLTAEAMSDD